jgi:hypothetical protein
VPSSWGACGDRHDWLRIVPVRVSQVGRGHHRGERSVLESAPAGLERPVQTGVDLRARNPRVPPPGSAVDD